MILRYHSVPNCDEYSMTEILKLFKTPSLNRAFHVVFRQPVVCTKIMYHSRLNHEPILNKLPFQNMFIFSMGVTLV